MFTYDYVIKLKECMNYNRKNLKYPDDMNKFYISASSVILIDNKFLYVQNMKKVRMPLYRCRGLD